jgi:hypothetical protein
MPILSHVTLTDLDLIMYIRYANQKKKIKKITYGVRIYEKYIIFYVWFDIEIFHI